MEQGVIEKVHVPHADRKKHPDRKVPCIRLINEDAGTQGEVVPIADADFEGLSPIFSPPCFLYVPISQRSKGPAIAPA